MIKIRIDAKSRENALYAIEYLYNSIRAGDTNDECYYADGSRHIFVDYFKRPDFKPSQPPPNFTPY